VVSMVTRLHAGRSGLDSRQGQEIFLLSKMPRLPSEPTQSPVRWVTGDCPLGVELPRPEADHSPLSSAEVNNEWSYSSTPLIFKCSNFVINLKVGFLGRKYHGASTGLNYKPGRCPPWSFGRKKKSDLGRKK
jgi:hypothetical protein